MNPFRNILRLSMGDFVAKTLYFLAFIYMARTLGVTNYGVLEFALSVLTYFLLFSDGGLELWATREAARGTNITQLVAQVTPLRLLLAALAFGSLIALLPIFPDYPHLRLVLILFGLALLVQAVNFKWVFMGREQMTHVALGLMVAQIVFALAVFLFVRSPEAVIWVPVLKLTSDLAVMGYFWRLYHKEYRYLKFSLSFRQAGQILRPALTMGASHGLAQVSYNFDTVLLGFMLNPMAVGWYNAAYRPITALLAMPVTYFLGLFPVLSRTYTHNRAEFDQVVVRSLRLMLIFAAPIGVGGVILAPEIINFLFGPRYVNSILPFQILSWSVVLIMLRGTYRQALNAVGRQDLDLRCAGMSTMLNLGLNLLLIPSYGVLGAATATLLAEILWLVTVAYLFHQNFTPFQQLSSPLQPIMAALIMSAGLLAIQPVYWLVQAMVGGLLYFGVLLLLGEKEVWSWVQMVKPRPFEQI